MINIDWIIGVCEARINRFLRGNDIHTPAELQRSVFKIILPTLPLPGDKPDIYAHLFSNRVVISKQQSQEDVSIEVTIEGLTGLAKGDKLAALLLEKKILMHGDIGKAHALQHWLESLSLSKADAFTEVFGEALGNVFLSFEQQAEPLLNTALEFGKNIVEQLSSFSNKGSSSTQDDSVVKQQIMKLREQADRMEARLQAIDKQLNTEK